MKMEVINTNDYYSTVRKIETKKFVCKHMDLEKSILREVT